ncbi:hypothetical protein CRG98_009446 [Punica granatum]|uniref:Uncharacterized protein n=1 Tax=Punica granatum TaxID=22663 RepID=A0A2I0KNU8_PUNGR|nr:hypothetical protein CRG98_009446 [Punica granatum]
MPRIIMKYMSYYRTDDKLPLGHTPIPNSPQFTEQDLSMRKMPIWVQLRKIPLKYFHPKGISYLASAIGKPLYMDKATAIRSRLDHAKVCIEVEVEKQILEIITVDLGNNYTVNVLVDIPWLPDKCDRCNVFGHRCNNLTVRPQKAGPNDPASSGSAEKRCLLGEHPVPVPAEKRCLPGELVVPMPAEKRCLSGELVVPVLAEKRQTVAELDEEEEGQISAASTEDEWEIATTKKVQLEEKRHQRNASKGVA